MKGNHIHLIIFLCCSFLSNSVSIAEGTKELMPNAGSDTRILIARGSVGGQQRDPFAVYGEDPNYRLYIHISNPGTEKVYFGLGQNSGGALNWRIHAPDGTVVWPVPATPPAQTPIAGQPGFINSYTEAFNGPSILNPLGYNALSMSPTVDGDYYMTFEIGSGQQRDFQYFDITVVDISSPPGVAIPGRVFTKCWQIRNPQPWTTNTFKGLMYIYSSDGFVTKFDPNSMEGRDFSFSSNESGCYPINSPTIIGNEARRSQTGRHNYPQFPIFLNDPDNAAYPSGTIGELVIPPPPAQAVVTTSYCATGTIDFSFSVTQPGSVQIDLLLNAALGAPYVDRQIVQNVNKFGNIVTWDGFDGAVPPHPVPNNTQFNFSLTYINGMTHLPLYDVESNSGGFKVYLVRPPSSAPIFYWDDIYLSGGTTNLTGCQSSPTSTCHPWGNSQGDQNTVNTWWYVSNTSTAPAMITERRTPGELGVITGPVDICEGGTTTYTVTADPNSDYYSWTTPSGTVTTTTSTISINLTSVPISLFLLKVHGVNDCGNGIESTLEINIHAIPITTINGPAEVCFSSTSNYTTQPGMANYNWTVTSGGIIASGAATNEVTVNWTGVGTQSITISYDDPFGCGVPTPAVKSITVNPLPTATISGSATVCQNTTPPQITFTGSIATPPYTFTYNINGGINQTVSTISGNSITIDAPTSVPGTFAYNLISVQDGSASACSQIQTGTSSVTITVNSVYPVILGNDSVCLNSSGNLYTTQSGMTKYTWTVSLGGTISSGGTKNDNFIELIWTTSGAKSVSVNFIDTNGCNAVSPTVLPVTIHPLPTPSISTSSLLAESFENEGNLPIGWTIESLTPGNSLSFVSSSSYPSGYFAYNGSYLMRFDSYDNDNGIIRLKRTSSISTLGLTQVNLDFAWLESSAVSVANDRMEVEWSPDGIIWNTFGSYSRYNAIQGWKVKNVVLPFAALNQPSLYVAFKFISDYGMDCYLDYIHMTAGITVCPGSTIKYETQTGMTNYIWSVSSGGIITSGAGTATIVVDWNTVGNQNVYVNYTNSNGCTAITPTTFSVPVVPLIPAQNNVSNVVVGSSQIKCYNATQSIIVAGNGTTFTVQDGGSSTMIAGQNIKYLPTTTVQAGGYMWGYIAPSGPWCQTPSMPAIAMVEDESPISIHQSSFKIYPNPTTGKFILELTGESLVDEVQVDIYGIWGEKVMSKVLRGERKHEFSLSNRPVGIYFIRVISGDKAETVKIVKH